jgi:hypothetical protein
VVTSTTMLRTNPAATPELAYVIYSDKNSRQLDRVYSVLIDRSSPVTLDEISQLTGIRSVVSIGGRIRELRTLGFEVERTLHPVAGKGAKIFQYRLV